MPTVSSKEGRAVKGSKEGPLRGNTVSANTNNF